MPADYQIYVKGRPGAEILHQLADLDPELRPGSTRLRVGSVDQAGLHGILGRLRNLGLQVDAVWRTDSPVARRETPPA